MSSENCQDFEVKYINDACVCLCVCVFVYIFAEEAGRLWPLMAAKVYQHYNHLPSRRKISWFQKISLEQEHEMSSRRQIQALKLVVFVSLQQG